MQLQLTGLKLIKVLEHRPDVLILDLSMPPGESGLIATSKISESFPDTKILILTMFDDEEYLFHVLKVVLKDTF